MQLDQWFQGARILSAVLLLVNNGDGSTIGDDIAAKLRTLANDGLGVQAFQNYLDESVEFVNQNQDGRTQVKQLAESISSRLNIRIQALTDLNTYIENAYSTVPVTSWNPYDSCCSVPVFQRDPYLNTTVNFNTWCTLGEKMNLATEFLPNAVLQELKTQYNKALGIKYAYFASHQGVLFNYPAVRVCQQDYDPRYRPWYVETVSPQPKDIVIVLDKSGSMKALQGSQSLMMKAQEAAVTVLDTLNPNDRVGIVAFSNDSYVPSGTSKVGTCHRTKLAHATPYNRDYLKDFINKVTAGGETYYNKALIKAFQYFSNSSTLNNGKTEREKVILFLTDGAPSEKTHSEIYDLIATQNNKLNNTVTILTYGLGTGVMSTVLSNMAKQVNTDPAYGDIKKGTHTPVPNANNLRSVMASYYEQFKQSGSSQVTFTVPYLDAFGSGLLVSMCLPTNYQGQLKGVTCMDLSVEDMIADVAYFSEGESSYAFMIDSTSRVFSHPLVEFETSVTKNPVFIHLNALEAIPGIDEVITNMTSGGIGTKSLTTTRIFSNGIVRLQGVYTNYYHAEYNWYPIQGTEFSVCLVIIQGDKKSSIKWSAPYPTSFLYHRLDLSDKTLSQCNNFDRVATKDQDTVFFAGRSFTDPYKYLNTNETQDTMYQYKRYMTGESQYNPGFKNGVRETVAATAKFRELMNKSSNYNMYSVRRFLSTNNGIHRIYPGLETPKEYDPTKRPWFVRAKANKGLLSLSPPYTDEFGAGYVITLSSVLYEGRPGGHHTNNGKTIGVIGMDFKVLYFYNMIKGISSKCVNYKCFIIDNTGFIILYPSWNSTKMLPKSRIHISQIEPYISERILEYNINQKRGCVNIATLYEQIFYKILTISGIKNSYFEIHAIPGTNAYVIVKIRRQYDSCHSCYNSYYLPKCHYLFNMASRHCTCPCYRTSSVYQFCSAQFDISPDGLKPCTPDAPAVNFSSVKSKNASHAASLPSCFDYNCSNQDTQLKCDSVVGCVWCTNSSTGEKLSTEYCSNYTSVCSANRTGSSSKWWIAFIVFIIIGIAAGVLAYIYRDKLCEKWNAMKCDDGPAEEPPSTEPPSNRAARYAPDVTNFINMKSYDAEPYDKDQAPPAYTDLYDDK